MQALLSLLGLFSLAFGLSYGVSYLFIAAKRATQKHNLKPVENARIRFKTSAAAYRSRLVEWNSSEWVIAAPLQRNAYVPISVGEELSCEVVAKGGVLLFKTHVIARCGTKGTLTLAAPDQPRLKNRRENERRFDVVDHLEVSGTRSAVIDLSEGGAKVRIQGIERQGRVLSVKLPDGEIREGTVLESERDGSESVIRLSFSQPVQVN